MTTNDDEDNKSLSQICEEYLASLTPSFKYQLKAGLKVLETVVGGFSLEWLYSHNAEDIQKFLRKARDKKGSPLKNNTQKQYASTLGKLQNYIKAHYQHEPPTSQVKQKEPILVDEAQDQPRLETSPPISELPQNAFDLKEWSELRDSVCPDCKATPFKDKDNLWYTVCSRPKEWKETKSGGFIPKGGTKGKIHIEECQRLQAFYIKRQLKTTKSEDFKETEKIDDLSYRITQLEGENRRLRQRITELEPFETALYMKKQIDSERSHIERLLNFPFADKPFKCWKGNTTLEKCSQFCGNYKDCKDRLNHEPTIVALSYIENQLRNRKYCPLKDQILSELECLECQDQEKCQNLKQDPTFLKDRMEKIIDLYSDNMYPLTSSLLRTIKITQTAISETPTQAPTLEKEPDWDTLKELPENIIWIDPETADLTVEQFEKIYGLNGSTSENEELDVFDIAEQEAEPLRFREGKTLEGNPPHITESPKPTTIEESPNRETEINNFLFIVDGKDRGRVR